MKKKHNVLLILSVIFVCAGVLLCAAAAALIVFLPNSWNVDDFHTVNHTVTEPFTAIRVEGKSDSNLNILPATEGQQYLVVSYEQESFPHTVRVEDGTLIIRRSDERKWHEQLLSFSVSTPKITVYLPEATYDSLYVDNATGDVETHGALTFGDVDIHTSTGDVTLRSQVTGDLTVKVSTADIDVRMIHSRSVTLSATTGDITLYNARVEGDVRIETDTGSQSVSELQCRNLMMECTTGGLSCGQMQIEGALQFESNSGRVSLGQVQCGSVSGETSSGDIICEGLTVTGKLSMEANTGDIKLTRSDAAELEISTDTGDVEGSLLSEKIFYTESDTGHIRVPKGTSGGLCEVKTDTGSITFTIIE